MSEEDNSQERTEEATERRKKEFRDKGQVVRSKELPAFIALLTGTMYCLFGSSYYEDNLKVIFLNLDVEPSSFHFSDGILKLFVQSMTAMIDIIVPLGVMVFIGIVISSGLIGGFVFYLSSIVPKFDRLDPFKGLARMFSMKTVMELLKAILKFTLVLGVIVCIVMYRRDDIIMLNALDYRLAITNSLELIGYSLLWMVCSLILIVGIDVPFQIMQYLKQIKMTKQEVKDEYKETEGRPEVKSKIRSMQQKIAQSRMMQKVPEADVIITNPTHYAVAVQYKPDSMDAPIVIAKGADFMAKQIIEVGTASSVPVVSLPMLARSIYHTTELEQSIPSGLYVAVAQVLAYIYQLKVYTREGRGKKPILTTEVEIPEELRY